MSESASSPTQSQSENTTVEMVTASEEALKQFQEILKDKPGYGIRLGVAGGGCAGLQYKMDPCEAPVEEDLVQEMAGVKFFIHPMAAPYLKGIHLDYSHSLMESGFKFMNPNATSTCGCGTSFGI
jgi:iron-sulfur cluster assembly accessory protein